MTNLNITKVIDQWGWAYHFISQEMSRYSIHNIKSQKYNQIDYNNMDICVISSPNISLRIAADVIPSNCRARKIKCIGQYSGEVDMLYSNCVDLIVTISPQLYYYAKKQYKDIPVIFLPESIDTNYFIPSERPINRFIPGWAGGPNKLVKRRHLFEYLIYPVKQMCEHGTQYFHEGASLDKMKDFYTSIDCFVLPSSTECQPRVVMEAMACELPVISTNVGSIPMLLQSNMIITTFPESQVIYEMNKKLEQLEKNPEFRFNIGERNRVWIEEHFSWKINMPIWSEIFSLLKDNNISKIEQISNNFISEYSEVFIEDKYIEQIAKFEKPFIPESNNIKRNIK